MQHISEVTSESCVAAHIFVTFSGVAIMLSITIFATVVGEMLPVSDATPLIG